MLYKWKKCIKDDFPYCENIYPTQQRKVKELVDHLKINDNVRSITLFGSSVTPACHADSDVDLYLELQKDIKVIDRYFDFSYDIWTNFSVDNRLKNEISKKGIKLYERI